MTDTPQQLHRSFQAAFNQHDLESIVALYELHAVIASVNGPVRGIEAIREWYRGALAMRPCIDLCTLSVTRVGDLALLQGKWSLHETDPEGRQIRRDGRNAEVVRQQRNGLWLFVIDSPSGPLD